MSPSYNNQCPNYTMLAAKTNFAQFICGFQGALVGFFTGLVFTIWLGVGAYIYKPAVWKPPVSVAGCPVENMTSTWSPMTTEILLQDTTLTSAPLTSITHK